MFYCASYINTPCIHTTRKNWFSCFITDTWRSVLHSLLALVRQKHQDWTEAKDQKEKYVSVYLGLKGIWYPFFRSGLSWLVPIMHVLPGQMTYYFTDTLMIEQQPYIRAQTQHLNLYLRCLLTFTYNRSYTLFKMSVEMYSYTLHYIYKKSKCWNDPH